MLILWGLLLRLNSFWIISLSIVTLAVSHGLTLTAAPMASLISPWQFLFLAGNFGVIGTGYPPLPWAAIAGFGIVFGRLLLRDESRAYFAASIVGLALTLLFVGMRANGLGDLHPATGTSWIDFLRVTKYPPSPAFVALTLGANLLLLFTFNHGSRWLPRLPVLSLFGQTALFFYFAHTWLYLLIGLAFPTGMRLLWVYPIWILGLLALYPLCRRFYDYKHKQPEGSWWRIM